MLLLAVIALAVALLILPLDIWALPFRASAALSRACQSACGRLAAWAFPRR